MDDFADRMMQIPGVLGVSLPGQHIYNEDSYLVLIEIGTDFMAPVFPHRHDGKTVLYKELPRPVQQ